MYGTCSQNSWLTKGDGDLGKGGADMNIMGVFMTWVMKDAVWDFGHNR